MMLNKVMLLLTFNFLLVTVGFAQQTEIDSLKQVLAIQKSDTSKVKLLIKIGNQLTDLDSVFFYYTKAEKIAKDSKSEKFLAKAYYYLGGFYSKQNNFDTAIVYYKKALEISENISNTPGVENILGQIGRLYLQKSNYSKALEYFQKELKVNKQLDNKKLLAGNYGNIGISYYYQNDYKKAIEYLEEAVKNSKEVNDELRIAINTGNIGLIYDDKNNYPKALEYYKKSLSLFENMDYKIGIASNLGNIGIVYKNQSNFKKAAENMQKALEIYRELDSKIDIANNLGNIGVVFMNQGNNKEAIEYYKEAIKINKEINNEYGMAYNYGNIGIVYMEQNNYDKALEYYNKSIEISEKIGDNYEVAYNLAYLGVLYNRNKQYQKSIEYSSKALRTYQEIGITQITPYENLSLSFWALDHTRKSANNFDVLINIINKNILLNFSILPEKAKQLYFEGIKTAYWQYNSFVLRNTDDFPYMIETVYNNTVKNKGLLLKSNTAMRNAIYTSGDSVLMKNYDNWVVIKTQIAKTYSNGGDAVQLESKADSLEANLVKNSNEFSDFKKVQNIDWKQVQSNLKENEVAIEFTHFPLLNPDSSYTKLTNKVQYLALIITPKSKYPEMIPLFEEKQLEQIIGKFGGNNYSYINSIYGKNDEVNTELYNLIWKPMEASLKRAKKVYISPDGLLHKISFSAIAKEQNVYLCDAYDIEVKSTTGKITKESKTQNLNNATLFGGITYDTDSTEQKVWNYLEGTKTETQKIDKILKKGKIKVNYYTNTLATEEEFKLMASNSNILHIATHGFFYPDPTEVEKETEKKVEYGDVVFRGGSRGFGVNSFVENNNPLMRSGLVFAGANDVWSKQTKSDSIDDGVLTAQEVANIDMRKTELVVMSACETGLGDIKGSEGVYGLQRAFKMAGVKYEIMSLWQVPDKETEEFMTTFYKKLIKNSEIKQAFADTQKEMRAKYDPYFWAAFVLIE